MIYCGMDIASKSSYVYVTDKHGRKLTSGEIATTRKAFEERLRRYVGRGLAIAIEAGNQTAWIYKALVEMGGQGNGSESDESTHDRRELMQDR